ncbi:GNAT family N-acetyltransferase [Vibrio ouci]|uniref:GNAT family N-acetyltransferase n=1 Tax=Vibrio ouci TaxID=2499078 RepID=A0A4Y8WJ52_9VIBR|nr:GNAT family N-acetyltransferase [Vibrio ouci]TFH92849.1 GNAT family N-acetyltransferase [Vibrio ouci]
MFIERQTTNQLNTYRGLELQRRGLTHQEALLVMEQISSSPDITGYSYREWTKSKDTFVLLNIHTGEFIGAILVHDLLDNWSEIAVVFICEKYRSVGYGHYLLNACIRTLKHSNKKLFLFYSKAVMETISINAGFEIFASEKEFINRSLIKWLSLNIIYKALWLSNAYRLREIRRKKKQFGSDFNFKMAVYLARS